MDVGLGTTPNRDNDMQTTAPPSAAFTMLSSPNCFVETANWLSIGKTSTESNFPVRTNSGMFATFTKKNAWKSCAIIWCVPTSSTTSHFVQSPIRSTLPKMMLKKNDLSAEPQNFDDHPQEKIGLETQLANERVAEHDEVDFDVTPHRFFLSPSYRRNQPPLE